MIIDPIVDLLNRIRNGYMARLKEVRMPYSRIKSDILKIFVKNSYIVSYEVIDLENNKKDLLVKLNDVRVTKYVPSFKRISKPGQRIYIKHSDIKKSKNGHGIFILSTPKGVITGYEARALSVGGELLCEVF
ncbi:MAG: 30S ribosomal protein S8 [Candidatus Gracilibacteria bacterium]|nr:30S ribosomal protein S8 [Candidatus Gracilibacteria bacterium]MDD3119832.1 30S ribosomal protein S8 [Candidatus Gracilibacteria bacterium]MDD4530437.1 30S ribosomal protein S8 [Candidatus Gracilibacteria bacterium]